ncbi:MAG: hypothetical protein LAT67_11150 [Balneolales bacterium]|nr:hypothetical protein [Balneolales bacterium]
MERLSIDYLKKLHAHESEHCISLYMPTHKVGNEVRQDKIRFKNLLNQAVELLKNKGLRDAEIDDLMKPLEEFRDESPNWQKLSDGLVIFRSKSHFEVNQFPQNFSELLVVGHRYHLKPLLPLLNGDGLYYLLALSQNTISLYEGTRFSISEVDSSFLPENLAKALRIDEFLDSQQFHTGGPVTQSGNRAALFHGHGGADEDQKSLIQQFFRQINKELTTFLSDRNVPLVLAGVEYLHPLYHQVNSHPGLLKKGVTGNADSFSADELHERSWDIVSEVFANEQKEAEKQFTELNGSSKVLTSIEEILPAATQGKLQTLFIAIDEHIWGRFDETAMELRLEKLNESPEDLIDLAAIKALVNGGKVYGVKRSDVPRGLQLAGITRY